MAVSLDVVLQGVLPSVTTGRMPRLPPNAKPLRQMIWSPRTEPDSKSRSVSFIWLNDGRSVYPSATVTTEASAPLASSVVTRTVVAVPASDSGAAVAVVTHSSLLWPLDCTAHASKSPAAPALRMLTRIRAGSTLKPVPRMVRRTPPPAPPVALPAPSGAVISVGMGLERAPLSSVEPSSVRRFSLG